MNGEPFHDFLSELQIDQLEKLLEVVENHQFEEFADSLEWLIPLLISVRRHQADLIQVK